MEIIKSKNGSELTLALSGRLDTLTAGELEAAINEQIDSADKLVLDIGGLEYVSSAGLRVLLSAQKRMGVKGGMVVKNVNEMVSEIFDITGFSDILNIE